MRRVYVNDKAPVKYQKTKAYKLNPVKQPVVKGTITEIWPNPQGGFVICVEWKDKQVSIELTDVRVRVGSEIRL